MFSATYCRIHDLGEPRRQCGLRLAFGSPRKIRSSQDAQTPQHVRQLPSSRNPGGNSSGKRLPRRSVHAAPGEAAIQAKILHCAASTPAVAPAEEAGHMAAAPRPAVIALQPCMCPISSAGPTSPRPLHALGPRLLRLPFSISGLPRGRRLVAPRPANDLHHVLSPITSHPPHAKVTVVAHALSPRPHVRVAAPAAQRRR